MKIDLFGLFSFFWFRFSTYRGPLINNFVGKQLYLIAISIKRVIKKCLITVSAPTHDIIRCLMISSGLAHEAKRRLMMSFDIAHEAKRRLMMSSDIAHEAKDVL
jgi:hypothetical protein